MYALDAREFADAHELWITDYRYRVNDWKILILRDHNPKVVGSHLAFTASQEVRFSMMAMDENIRAGDMTLAEVN